jgi:hypothetical protein
VSLTAGTSFGNDRGTMYINASYDWRGQIRGGPASERDFLSETFISNVATQTLVPFRNTVVPSGRAVVNGQLAYFNQSGELFSAPGVINPLTFDRQYNLTEDSLVLQGGWKAQVFAGFTYDVDDRVRVYFDGIAVHSELDFPRFPEVANLAATQFSVNNPFIGPLTRTFFAGANQTFTIPGLVRRFTEVGDTLRPITRDSFRGVGGVRVDLFGDWTVDASALYQQSSFDVQFDNFINLARLQQALNAVPGPNGTVVCADPSGGCVPLNIFGANNISPAAADFITARPSLHGKNSDTIANVTATGTLLNLPAGPVRAAVAAEYRRSFASEIPDDSIIRTGITSLGKFGNVFSGADEYYEFFGELVVPILSERPFFNYLGLEAGARHTTIAGASSAWSYKILGEWSPIRQIKFRGGFQRAIRAASIFERFGEDNIPSVSTPGLDPCATGAPLTGTLRTNCLANGVPVAVANVGLPNTAFPFTSRLVGAEGIEPEIGNSFTAGVVVNSLLENLILTADYYDIRLTGAIGRFGNSRVVGACINQADPRACAGVTRDPVTGRITIIDNFFVNAGEQTERGIDFSLHYRTSAPTLSGQAGRLNISSYVTHRFESSILFAGETEEVDCAGRFGFSCTPTPKWQAFTRVDYSDGPFSIFLNWRYFGPVGFDFPLDQARQFLIEDVLHIDAENTFDLGLSFAIGDRYEFFGGVDNVFDNAPPVVGIDVTGSAFFNTYPTQYDQIGRRFYAGVRFRM